MVPAAQGLTRLDAVVVAERLDVVAEGSPLRWAVVEVHPWPQTIDVLEQLAPVFADLT
jgi:hypothetical protein